MVLLVIFMLVLAASPSWLMWLLAARYLPERYVMPPNRMTILCFLLSLLTAFLFNVELEGGILSVPFFVLILSVLWSVLLIPACAFARHFLRRQRANSSTVS